MFDHHLRQAIQNLPPGVALWISRAIRSDWFQLAPGAYADEGSGAVCPIAAAALMAGVWGDSGLLPDRPEWGSVRGPSAQVEDFAAYFDLCAEELGTAQALPKAARSPSASLCGSSAARARRKPERLKHWGPITSRLTPSGPPSGLPFAAYPALEIESRGRAAVANRVPS